MKTHLPLSRSFSLLALLLLAGGCKKEKELTPLQRLPPATTTGADTWGCLVNGEVWTSNSMRGDWTTADGMSVSMGFTSYVDNQPQAHNIVFSFLDSTNSFSLTTGYYTLSPYNGSHSALIQTPSKRYRPDKLLSGVVHLTRLDKQARIVSGTFDFIVADGPNDTIRVTDGRFDGHLDL